MLPPFTAPIVMLLFSELSITTLTWAIFEGLVSSPNVFRDYIFLSGGILESSLHYPVKEMS